MFIFIVTTGGLLIWAGVRGWVDVSLIMPLILSCFLSDESDIVLYVHRQRGQGGLMSHYQNKVNGDGFPSLSIGDII